MKIFKLICILFLAFNISAKALIRNVPAQYSTIQSAINISVNGDTVLVQPGTFFENINFRGKKIVLTGTFYQNNNYSAIQSTIINGSTPAFPDSASCVIINPNEDSTTVLQGFTLTGGSGTKWADEHGAGVYREGGGLLIQYSSPVIQFNIFTGNQNVSGGVVSTGGAAMRIGDCYPRVLNNVIYNNTARYGAGVVLNYTGGEYRNNLIFKNYGSVDYGAGSGIWINGSYTRPRIIENNTVVFNSALGSTPGVYGFGNAAASFRNNIVWGNTSPASGQISGSSISVNYCDVQGGFSGAGNMNIDPLFDSTNYYLKGNSPCIDKGDSSLIYNDPPDPNNLTLAKWPARGLLRNDMGAYGGPGSRVIANSIVGITGNGKISSPDNFQLMENYPNPFNPQTTIEYVLAQNSFVNINIYNSLGDKVQSLSGKYQVTGSHSVEFNAVNLSSGVYYYELVATAGGNVFSGRKKMILIK